MTNRLPRHSRRARQRQTPLWILVSMWSTIENSIGPGVVCKTDQDQQRCRAHFFFSRGSATNRLTDGTLVRRVRAHSDRHHVRRAPIDNGCRHQARHAHCCVVGGPKREQTSSVRETETRWNTAHLHVLSKGLRSARLAFTRLATTSPLRNPLQRNSRRSFARCTAKVAWTSAISCNRGTSSCRVGRKKTNRLFNQFSLVSHLPYAHCTGVFSCRSA